METLGWSNRTLKLQARVTFGEFDPTKLNGGGNIFIFLSFANLKTLKKNQHKKKI